MHEPLSQSLARILEDTEGAQPLTANQVIARTEGRGMYLVLILLSLPFVAWVSVPGMSTVFGPMIGWLGLRLALGKVARLPAKLGDRALSPKVKQTILGGGMKFFRWLEKAVRPRRTRWMTWRIARLGHALRSCSWHFCWRCPCPHRRSSARMRSPATRSFCSP